MKRAESSTHAVGSILNVRFVNTHRAVEEVVSQKSKRLFHEMERLRTAKKTDRTNSKPTWNKTTKNSETTAAKLQKAKNEHKMVLD
jgi:hypothetical protein